jgi:hypothetical protein
VGEQSTKEYPRARAVYRLLFSERVTDVVREGDADERDREPERKRMLSPEEDAADQAKAEDDRRVWAHFWATATPEEKAREAALQALANEKARAALVRSRRKRERLARRMAVEVTAIAEPTERTQTRSRERRAGTARRTQSGSPDREADPPRPPPERRVSARGDTPGATDPFLAALAPKLDRVRGTKPSVYAVDALENARLAVELEEEARRERARVASRRFWAAVLLVLDVDACESVLLGRPVLASKLDYVMLRRAVRGSALPPSDSFVRVTPDMLDAVAECGPLPGPLPPVTRRAR